MAVFVVVGVFVFAYLELDHVMAAEAVDELGGSAFGDDLAMIDDGEAVAEAFSFVHVVSGEEDGPTFFLEDADDVPELAAALGIESGGGLVEKKDARIADQRGGYGRRCFWPPESLPTQASDFSVSWSSSRMSSAGRGSL